MQAIFDTLKSFRLPIETQWRVARSVDLGFAPGTIEPQQQDTQTLRHTLEVTQSAFELCEHVFDDVRTFGNLMVSISRALVCMIDEYDGNPKPTRIVLVDHYRITLPTFQVLEDLRMASAMANLELSAFQEFWADAEEHLAQLEASLVHIMQSYDSRQDADAEVPTAET